ncbi:MULTISPECIES: LysE/ArgO family amino acid transporter [Comamonas]|nr:MULTISPECIES: LysE family transporter [Comamonas]UUC95791.1 LysE family transporter [Comamonas sp. C11]WEE80013.1 LysE family transporter [Comamonas testosteroni]
MDMTTNFYSAWIAGFTVCASLIVSIGAQNLYVLRQAVQGEHVKACVALCVLSDGLLVALGVAGMAQMLTSYPALAQYLTLGGAAFLLAYGLFALRRMWLAPDAAMEIGGRRAAPRGMTSVLAALAAITLLNPHVYLDTVLLMGSIGAQQEGAGRWSYVMGAASASCLWFVLLAMAGRRLKHLFANPGAWRVMDGITGVMMLGLAWWVASSALGMEV